MKSLSSKRSLVFSAVFGSIAYAALAALTPAGAQTSSAPSVNQADSALGERVRNALHSDPYFYDEHVTVSVEKGVVVLRGFVTSEWDQRDAIRIANTAAGGRRVVDNLSIKMGGNR